MPGTAERRRMERLVHWSLLGGLVVSGLLLATGLVLALARGEPRPDGPPPALPAVWRAALRGEGPGLLDLGLLALIGTPILRVAVLAVGWLAEGERRFALVAMTVLALLALGLALGLG